jgi:hypothetical protein
VVIVDFSLEHPRTMALCQRLNGISNLRHSEKHTTTADGRK